MMTREEIVNSPGYQITKAAIEYYKDHPNSDPITAFEMGAEMGRKLERALIENKEKL